MIRKSNQYLNIYISKNNFDKEINNAKFFYLRKIFKELLDTKVNLYCL